MLEISPDYMKGNRAWQDKENYYDSIAEGYEELYGKEQEIKLDIIKKEMTLSKSSKVLDVGCGSGISSRFDCYCIGIDPSKKLIDIAKKNDPYKSHRYMVIKAEDLASLRFCEGEFDYLISVSAVHHFKRLDGFLREAKRISKSQVLTVLKKIENKDKIISKIRKILNVNKIVEDKKDIIIICNSPQKPAKGNLNRV